jgi:hypothetical protein
MRTAAVALTFVLSANAALAAPEKIEFCANGNPAIMRFSVEPEADEHPVRFYSQLQGAPRYEVINFASRRQGNRYDFGFDDVWGNEGQGVMSHDGDKATLELKVVASGKGEAAAQARRHYGTFSLDKKACAGVPDFTP